MSIKKKASQIIKSAMYDELREEYKQLLIKYDLLLLKHNEFKKLFDEYKDLQHERAETLRKIIEKQSKHVS